MLTYNPDTTEVAEDGASALGGEMVVRVVHGELVTGADPGAGLARSAGSTFRWLERAVERSPSHHAVGNYLAEERPIGTRFDRYV